MPISSILLLVAGAAMIYLVRRRRFNRRNEAGVEMFDNYEKAFLTRILEKIATIIGFFLILFAIVNGCVQSNLKKQQERKLQNDQTETQQTR